MREIRTSGSMSGGGKRSHQPRPLVSKWTPRSLPTLLVQSFLLFECGAGSLSEAVECVVVGAGVVGLAVARALARVGIEVMVLEREYGIGFETSSRNSEVIHA